MTKETKRELASRLFRSGLTTIIGLAAIGFAFYKYIQGQADGPELAGSIAAGLALLGVKEAGK